MDLLAHAVYGATVCSRTGLAGGAQGAPGGAGRFQTTVFYPLSTWSLDSIHWWQHPRLVMAYWILLPALWYGLWVWRGRTRRADIHRA